MKRETWLAITAALGLAAFGGVWFAIKAPDLADPGAPSARPKDPLSGMRVTPARRFYAPSVDHNLMEIAARRPLFNQRRESYGTAASLALPPSAGPDPNFTLAPLREAAQPLTGAATPPDALVAPRPDDVAGIGSPIETAALAPPASPSSSPNAELTVNLGPIAAATTPATPRPSAPAAQPPTSPAPTPPAPRPAATTPAPQPVVPNPPAPVAVPAPSAPPASGPPPSGPSIHPGALALAAVFPRDGGRSAALIRLPDNSIIEGGVGATVAGWRVESMTAGPPSSVTLWNGRERVTLRAGR